MLCINYVILLILDHLVQPSIQQIRVEPDEQLNQDQKNFSIICNFSANYSHVVEFLFRSDKNEQFKSVENITSVEESPFTWVATLYVKRNRESNGEYLCRDNNTNATIAANIICIIIIFVLKICKILVK